MGRAVERLIALAAVRVEGHTRVVDGKTVHVDSYVRTLRSMSNANLVSAYGSSLTQSVLAKDSEIRSKAKHRLRQIRSEFSRRGMDAENFSPESMTKKTNETAIEYARLSDEDFKAKESVLFGAPSEKDAEDPYFWTRARALEIARDIRNAKSEKSDPGWNDTNEDLDALVHEQWEILDGGHTDDLDGWKDYVGTGHWDINRSLRKVPDPDRDDTFLTGNIERMERVFEAFSVPLPRDSSLFRFLEATPDFNPATFSVGTKFRDKAYVSTSTNSWDTSAFGDWGFLIKAKKGTKVLGGHFEESELIFNKGSIFEVTYIDHLNRRLEVRVV